jgi:hypothetical protein
MLICILRPSAKGQAPPTLVQLGVAISFDCFIGTEF